jgi:hypothetical protein
MTVSELIEQLKTMPPDAPVWVGTDCHGCFGKAKPEIRLDSRGMVVIES